MKVSDYMIDLMVKNGIDRTWVFQGGAISHVIDSAYLRHQKDGSIEPYTVLHEQSASMAADAYARITGKVASVMVTSGPGATNLLTGVACSWYDSVPGLYLTGQVRTLECKTGGMRQPGFQETDIVSMVETVTKYAKLITDPRDIRYEFEKALWLATTGRPGPVLLDLPMDIQWADVDPKEQRPFYPPKEKWNHEHQNDTKLHALAELISNAKRPVILSGGGVRNSGAGKQLIEFAEKCNIPITVSFGGKDLVSNDHRLFCGLIGAMGNEAANETLHNADLVLALGTRLSWRQVRMQPDKFVPDAKIVHVDIDADEHNQHIPAVMNFSWDCSKFITGLSGVLESRSLNFSDFSSKRKKAFQGCPFYSDESFSQNNAIHPHRFFNTLSKNSLDDEVYIADTGQNLVWSMQGLEIKGKQRIITAWGHSPMGYSIAAALGPVIIPGLQRVICLIGDGGIQLNIQELQTIRYFNYPIIIFVLNNHSYGAIKDFQDGNLEGRHFATAGDYGYQPPDFIAVAKAYGIPAMRLNDEKQLDEQLKTIMSSNGPLLVDVELGNNTDMVLSLVKG